MKLLMNIKRIFGFIGAGSNRNSSVSEQRQVKTQTFIFLAEKDGKIERVDVVSDSILNAKYKLYNDGYKITEFLYAK